MTDEKYTFVTDLRERKSAARGAAHRKCGAKSKRCTLPSDHLTPTELKRRNSPVSTVQLNKPLTYANLKALPPTLQFEYLDHLIQHRGARRIDLLAMLGAPSSTFAEHCKTLPGKLRFRAGQKHPTPEWKEFIETPPIIDPPADVDPAPVQPLPKPAPDPILQSGSITISGKLDDLIGLLSKLIGPTETFTFTTSFTK